MRARSEAAMCSSWSGSTRVTCGQAARKARAVKQQQNKGQHSFKEYNSTVAPVITTSLATQPVSGRLLSPMGWWEAGGRW